jgi:glycosyltransferase involved in cell wall biosynthesis
MRPPSIFAFVTSSPQAATARRQQLSAVKSRRSFQISASRHIPTRSTLPGVASWRLRPNRCRMCRPISLSSSSIFRRLRCARRSAAPVIFHKHNMTKAVPRGGVLNNLRRRWRLRQYNSLAGIIFVSHACKDAFQKDWPEVQTPCAVVHDGLDFSEWHPSQQRLNEIICVGRAAPEKGIKEAALAMAAVLGADNGWRGRLIHAEPNRFPEYLDEVLAAIRPRGDNNDNDQGAAQHTVRSEALTRSKKCLRNDRDPEEELRIA